MIPRRQDNAKRDWFRGIDLFSRLDDPIAEKTRLEQSLLFAELSQIAYMPPEPALECAHKIGFDEAIFFDRDGAQAYRFRNASDCVIVCRGTEPTDWNDVKADVNAVTVLAEAVGRVHSGFKREVDDLWPFIERALSGNRQPLWFAGHSLGGAMATICARRYRLSRMGHWVQGLFTYGSPRVGNRAYVNYCRLVHYRWVNNNDIVTRVPPTWWGYRHGGREMYIDALGRVRSVVGWHRVLDRLRGFVVGLRQFQIDPLADHSIEQYIAHIHAAVQRQRRAMAPHLRRRQPLSPESAAANPAR